MHNFLAIDLGAETGRLILGNLDRGRLTTSEVRRFSNEPVHYHGGLHWDIARLWFEIRRGLLDVSTTAINSVAVDSWGVDYALLGEAGQLLSNPYHYRDCRTEGMVDRVCHLVPRSEIYAQTGIQFLPINTLYQLFAAKQQTPRLLALAERLLTIPDLFHFWLSGNAVCEYTNATTTQMVNPWHKTWATDLLRKLELPTHLLGPIVEPCSVLGATETGIPVVAPASHDTGSAVAAIEARDGVAFLSSGTWSLLGAEIDTPVINETARRLNFTNEGGLCGTTRLLKNVMGLWMLQGCRKSLAERGQAHSYQELVNSASSAPAFRTILDPDHSCFLNPACMLEAIDRYCGETEQPKPENAGTYARTVLESLALRYRVVLDELEQLARTRIHTIRVIGGGSRNNVLNQWTADATGRTVLAGPVEATALGNIAAQMLAMKAAGSLAECRHILANSYETATFYPQNTEQWEKHLCLRQ